MAKINYSDTEKSIVATLKVLGENLADGERDMFTLAEISKEVGKELKSGNINALVKKGNVEVGGDIVLVCPVCHSKRKVRGYRFVKDIED